MHITALENLGKVVSGAMKVTILSRALTASGVPLNIQVADAIRVSIVDLQFKECCKIALDFGMTEAGTGGGTDKDLVVNAIGDPPRGHRHSERAYYTPYWNRDYRPGLVAQHMRRADMTVTFAVHEITTSSAAPACLLRGDHKGNRPQHCTAHYGPGVAHAAAARPLAPPPQNSCAGIPKAEVDQHLRIITLCGISQIRI